jgi:hypothetical protein
MPPQQPDRLLDLVDDILDFRAHHHPAGVRDASPPAGCSDCARSTQWAPMRGTRRWLASAKPASQTFRPDRLDDEFTAAAMPNCIAGKACFL